MSSQGSWANIPNNGAGPPDPRNDIGESDDPFTFREVPFGSRARKSSSESGSDDSRARRGRRRRRRGRDRGGVPRGADAADGLPRRQGGRRRWGGGTAAGGGPRRPPLGGWARTGGGAAEEEAAEEEDAAAAHQYDSDGGTTYVRDPLTGGWIDLNELPPEAVQGYWRMQDRSGTAKNKTAPAPPGTAAALDGAAPRLRKKKVKAGGGRG